MEAACLTIYSVLGRSRIRSHTRYTSYRKLATVAIAAILPDLSQ
ncbi:MAG: hypothetical protein ACBR15_06045 [Microcoleus sp.]